MSTVIKKREPNLDELLADPMMATVLHYANTTPEALRALMRDARERLARGQTEESEQPGTAKL